MKSARDCTVRRTFMCYFGINSDDYATFFAY